MTREFWISPRVECARVEHTEVEPLVSALRRFASRLRIVSAAGTATRTAFERIDVAGYDDFRAALRDLGEPAARS